MANDEERTCLACGEPIPAGTDECLMGHSQTEDPDDPYAGESSQFQFK